MGKNSRPDSHWLIKLLIILLVVLTPVLATLDMLTGRGSIDPFGAVMATIFMVGFALYFRLLSRKERRSQAGPEGPDI